MVELVQAYLDGFNGFIDKVQLVVDFVNLFVVTILVAVELVAELIDLGVDVVYKVRGVDIGGAG